MKWWILLTGKALFLLLLHLALILGVNRVIPDGKLGTHLPYSLAVMGTDVSVFVVGYFLWLDQRYRCRTCLRRLLMPVATGNFSKATLFAPPKMEWICAFGHGTLREPGAQLGTPAGAEWVRNDDNFWKAFEDAWRKD